MKYSFLFAIEYIALPDAATFEVKLEAITANESILLAYTAAPFNAVLFSKEDEISVSEPSSL